MVKMCNGNCDYDSDGNRPRDKNRALDRQTSHSENTDFKNCCAAHCQPLKSNRKKYNA